MAKSAARAAAKSAARAAAKSAARAAAKSAARAAAKGKERWDFRVPPATDRLVRRAAELRHRTLTDFVVDAAVDEAERTLADRTQFILDTRRWNQFVQLLDCSPQERPGLEKLFEKPSVFKAE